MGLTELLWGNVPKLPAPGWQGQRLGGDLSLGNLVPCLFPASWLFNTWG